MPHRRSRSRACFGLPAVALTAVMVSHAEAQSAGPTSGPQLLVVIEATMAAAEAALREGELQVAESRYRDALMQGWMLIGALEVTEGRPAAARDVFRRATGAAADNRAAQRLLAIASLQAGDSADAVGLLSRLVTASPDDVALRRVLAQALVARGEPAQAVQELEHARGIAPGDPELAFVLATAYLRVKRVDAAERVFDEVARARPIPQTYVLIGRTYRDFGEYGRARAALRTALEKDPRVRRAHYYLGTIAILEEEGYARLEEAIAEFRAELTIAPQDPVTNLRLGIALEHARRHDEALAALEVAARDPAASSEVFEFLGRCQLAVGRTADAVGSLRRALETRTLASDDSSRIGRLHYQLATALRTLGRMDEASQHFAQAQRASEARAKEDRARLGRFLADVPESDDAAALPTLAADAPFADVPAVERARIRQGVTTALARAYLNLGVLHAQASRFVRAAEFLEDAAALDPAFPQVQYSLGVAYFNAQKYEAATAPLERAVAADPRQTDARRMLALAWLNLEAYDKAVDLLNDDPRRGADPSLQYAYALALVRSGRPEEAEQIFTQLLAAHGDSPELNVLVGQAHAQQGDFAGAIRALQHALALKKDAENVNATLGTIYLKQGRLDEAAAALRAELAAHPDAVTAKHTLGAVLELQGHLDEAVTLLRSALQARPHFADARYLLGKILLAQGMATEAVGHLEAAARIAPEDANVHFQLAQAYEKTGRTSLSQEHFDIYRRLKEKARARK